MKKTRISENVFYVLCYLYDHSFSGKKNVKDGMKKVYIFSISLLLLLFAFVRCFYITLVFICCCCLGLRFHFVSFIQILNGVSSFIIIEMCWFIVFFYARNRLLFHFTRFFITRQKKNRRTIQRKLNKVKTINES